MQRYSTLPLAVLTLCACSPSANLDSGPADGGSGASDGGLRGSDGGLGGSDGGPGTRPGPEPPGDGASDVWTHVWCPDAPNSGEGFHRLRSFDELPNDPIGDGENGCYMEAFDTSAFSTDEQPLTGCGNLDLSQFPEHSCLEVRNAEDFRNAFAPGRRVAIVMNDLEVDAVPYVAGDQRSIYLIGRYDPSTLRPVLITTSPGLESTLLNWSSSADPHLLAIINLRLHTGGMCFSIGRRQAQGTYAYQSVTAKCNGRFVISSFENPINTSWSAPGYPESVPDLTEWPVDDRIYFRQVMTRGNRSHTVYLDRSFLNWVEDSIIMMSFTSGKHAAKFIGQNVYLHGSIFTNTGVHNEAIVDPEFSDTPRRSNLAALSLAACSRVVIDHVTVPYHYERAEANGRPIQWQIRDSIGAACDLPWAYYPNLYPTTPYRGAAEWLGTRHEMTPFWDPDWWAAINDEDPLDPNMITSMVISSRVHLTAEEGYDTSYLHMMGTVGTYPTTRTDAGNARNFFAPEVPEGWRERQRIIVNNNCLDDGVPAENATQNYVAPGMQDPSDSSRHRYDNTDRFVRVGSNRCADVDLAADWVRAARDAYVRSLPPPPWAEWEARL